MYRYNEDAHPALALAGLRTPSFDADQLLALRTQLGGDPVQLLHSLWLVFLSLSHTHTHFDP